jgi:arabinofuranosyltransferase
MLGLAAAATIAAVLVNAWVCDDAYVTLRTVEALLRGDGATWNPGVRVQAYTHPLWLAGLTVTRRLTGDAYAGTLLLCFACTLAALALLVRYAQRPSQAALPLLALGLSPSFVQFSTSGLENSLTHVLVLAFLVAYVRRRASLLVLAALTSLVLLDRMDAVLLLAPALLAATWEDARARGVRATARSALLGGLPFLLWEGFSLLYYGSLVPNTAYAKLAHGIERAEVVTQGLHYLWTFVTFDPAGAALVAAGLGLAALDARRAPRRALAAAGAALYVLYLIWIGGDFMAGRMLTPVLVVAAASVAGSRRWARVVDRGVARRLAVAAALVALGALPQWHVGTALRAAGLADLPEGPVALHRTHWVNEEQHHYFEATGLLGVLLEDVDPPAHPWAELGARWARTGGVHVHKNIGFAGYAAADAAHIIDPYGLSEPFLARLPAFRNVDFHVGHYYRWVPPGYVETVRRGECRMREESLCALWRDVRQVTEGPLWSAERFAAIVDLHRFEAPPEVAERFRLAHLVQATADVADPVEFRDSGLDVTFERARRGRIVVRVAPCVRYRVRLHRGDRSIRELEARAVPRGPWCALSVRAQAPFDRVRVLPLERPEGTHVFHYHGVVSP